MQNLFRNRKKREFAVTNLSLTEAEEKRNDDGLYSLVTFFPPIFNFQVGENVQQDDKRWGCGINHQSQQKGRDEHILEVRFKKIHNY